MIARLTVALPFNLIVPEGESFSLHPYVESSYTIVVQPPVRTDIPLSGTMPDLVSINGAAAFIANGLWIDFHKESFDRTENGEWDPPRELMQRAADSYLARLRYVTRSSAVRALDWSHVQFRVTYLDDDGSELAEEPGKVRGRGIQALHMSLTSVSKEIWDHIHNLGAEFSPPTWDSLRLDANVFLQDVGACVVLAATCLEVCISHVLDALAGRGDVPLEFWGWANDRKNFLANPSVEEQFDVLLKFFTKHSLKEDASLWNAFLNVKKARNRFVHEGTPTIDGKPVSKDDALQLLINVNKIIAWLREKLPEEIRWPEFEIKTQTTFEKLIS
jgi:hypothetical protein